MRRLAATLAVAMMLGLVALLLLRTNSLGQPSTASRPSAGATLLPATRSPLLSEEEAVRTGIQKAKGYGLQGEAWGVTARLMTLGESAQLVGAYIPDTAAQLGLDPKRLVWFVVMRGSVDLRGKVPSLHANEQTQFDNMSLTLDAKTGEVVAGPGVQNPGVALPLPVRVTPGAPTEAPIVMPIQSTILAPLPVTPVPFGSSSSMPPMTPPLLPTPSATVKPTPTATLEAYPIPSFVPQQPLPTRPTRP